MKTPKVGLGYLAFKREVMRCREREMERTQSEFAGNQPGASGVFRTSVRKKMGRGEETRLCVEIISL